MVKNLIICYFLFSFNNNEKTFHKSILFQEILLFVFNVQDEFRYVHAKINTNIMKYVIILSIWWMVEKPFKFWNRRNL